MKTVLKGKNSQVIIGEESPFVMIGERINPTGRKKLAAMISEKNWDYVKEIASDQLAWGADVLDINVGVPGVDEVIAITSVINLLSKDLDVPFCLDSANYEVLKAGLAAAQGKPLVNSVSGERGKLDKILPLVKDRNAAVIGLTIDDKGIPETPEERVSVAEKIIESALKIGIASEDVVIDPLVMSVGSNHKAALITLQTIELLRKSLGVNVCVGASNVSFGLPDRSALNQAFLTLCIQAGATCAITDPGKMGQAVKGVDLLLGRDNNSLKYLRYFRNAEKLRQSDAL